MKRIFTFAFSLVTLFIVLQSSAPLQKLKKDGAEPGHTGSPGDTLKNCTVCHGGTATTVSDWVTSNIPAEGYTPGQTYTITTTNNEFGATRFGFQVSPQNLKGDLLGELIMTDAVKTKLVGSGKYITYTENGVESVNSLTWTFNWKAPASGSGVVTFYGAFNSNYEGHKGGDKTYLSTLAVSEKGTTNTQNILEYVSNFTIYPNSTTDLVNISFNLKTKSAIKLEIADIAGKQIAVITNAKHSGSVLKQYSTAALANGIYFIRLHINGQTASQKLTVSH